MLYDALNDIVKRFPDRIAIVSGSRSVTYRELWALSDVLAQELKSRNVKPNDRIVILAQSNIESVAAWWAVIKCQAICLNLNEKLTTSGIQYIIDDAKPAMYLCGTSALLEQLPKVVNYICLDNFDWTKTSHQSVITDEPVASAEESIACIVYTSGSTGNPKGVCLTHRNLISVGNIAADGFRLTEQDSYLMVVPLHYIHGLMMLMSLQLRGACLQFMSSFVFPSAVTQSLQKNKITGFSGVPYHFSALMERGKFLTTELPDLRWICVTGGTFTPDRIAQLLDAKPDTEIHIAYGQTECSPRITMLDPERISRKPTSVGSVAPTLVLELLDEQGNSVNQGETGELVVSGPNVMHGYWNDQQSTSRVIDEQGRLHTGDLGYMDEEGDVFIRGRVQAMIKSAGERIFPEELEAVLNKHSNVQSAAVVGQDDDLYGQIVEAHIVLNHSEQTEHPLKDIESFCLEHVPFARAPRRYRVWSEFPLKANGKIDRQLLIQHSDER